MGWRIVVIKSKAKLDYKMDYLVVRTEEKTSRIHLSEISVLIIESTAVSLTAYLLVELSKKKVKVIFCDERCNPNSELCCLHGSYDTIRKVRQQINWDGETKKIVWSEIVKCKIKGQPSNVKEHYIEEREMLQGYLEAVEPRDVTNREGIPWQKSFFCIWSYVKNS